MPVKRRGKEKQKTKQREKEKNIAKNISFIYKFHINDKQKRRNANEKQGIERINRKQS